jgi:hypothetical protein
MYIQAAADLEWKDPPTGYYMSQVKEKILWTDSKTGAIVTLMKFPPGPLDKKHRHPNANQWDYWIKGSLKKEIDQSKMQPEFWDTFPKARSMEEP